MKRRGDLMEHRESVNCACVPKVINFCCARLVVHNAFDASEYMEEGWLCVKSISSTTRLDVTAA